MDGVLLPVPFLRVTGAPQTKIHTTPLPWETSEAAVQASP
jgi:hypothetical protein